MTVSCWTTRHEAAGYDDQTDAMLASLQSIAYDYDRADAMGAEAGYDVSPEWALREGGAWWLWDVWDVWGDTCVLDAGHPGPHEFTRTKDIMLTFPRLNDQADHHHPVGAEQGAPRLRAGEEP